MLPVGVFDSLACIYWIVSQCCLLSRRAASKEQSHLWLCRFAECLMGLDSRASGIGSSLRDHRASRCHGDQNRSLNRCVWEFLCCCVVLCTNFSASALVCALGGVSVCAQ